MIISTTAITAAALLSPADVADTVASQAADTADNSACIETVSSQEDYNIKLGISASGSYMGRNYIVDDWN